MKHDNMANFSNVSSLQKLASLQKSGPGSTFIAWWYSHFAPIEPPATASLPQREEVRQGKVASITTLLFMLFLIILLATAIIEKDASQGLLSLIGEGICTLILFINRKGYVKVAGLVMLGLFYIVGTLSIVNYPTGLTVADLPRLGLIIVPDMLALAFFSSSGLILVVLINVVQITSILLLAPHDASFTHLLQTSPSEIFLNVYLLQLITAVVLYMWARSTEEALARADHAEEIAAFERHEKERQAQVLEQKCQLDTGIQEILQTHVAVANGDLTARAPLHQTHALWQIANALNTLIARLQRVSQAEQELRQQIWKLKSRSIGPLPQEEHYRATDVRLAKITTIKASNPRAGK